MPQPSRRYRRPSGRHGLPARTLAIGRPCAANWPRRGPVDIEQCGLHLCRHPYLGANRGPIRPAVAQEPPSPTQRAREWALGRYCAYHSRWRDAASCLPSPVVRNSLPEPHSDPRGRHQAKPPCMAKRGHGSQEREPTRSDPVRLTATHSDVFAGERLSVRLRRIMPDFWELHGVQTGAAQGPISVSVRVTDTSTYSSAIFRAAPGRGMPQPSLRRSMNCIR